LSSPAKLDRAQRRRRQILDAAYRVFGDKGYQAASIADIATVLGIGHGTFYRYFDNKLDIFRHVIDEVMQRIGRVVMAEDPESTADLAGYRDQIGRLGRSLYELFMSEPQLAQLLFYEAYGIDAEIDRRVRMALDVFGGYTERYLRNGMKKGFLRPDLDASTTALAINAMIFEGARRVLRADDPEANATIWIDAVRRLMLDGMSAC
jgi:AcrR family transcriptional regulator